MKASPYRMMRSVEVVDSEAVKTAELLAKDGWIVLPEHTVIVQRSGVRKIRMVFGSHESKVVPPQKQGGGTTVPHGDNGTLTR